RETDLVMGAVHRMFAVIPPIMEAVAILSRSAELIYPELSGALVSARLAADLREQAGRLGSQFTGALAEQRRLYETETQEIRVLRGRIEQLRSLIHLSTKGGDADPRIADAVRTMDQMYFDADLRLVGVV